MTDVPDIVIKEFIEVCHAVAARGLVRCSSGNISLRLDSDRLLATSSRSWMEALADAVVEAMRTHDMVVMGNHGQVTVAQDFTHAIQNAEFFELACGVIVHVGQSLTPLPEDEIRHLLALRREKRGGGSTDASSLR